MNSDLTRRIAFTLGALLVYRIGTYIPLPGIDLAAWERIFRANSSGMLGMLSTGMHGMLTRSQNSTHSSVLRFAASSSSVGVR